MFPLDIPEREFFDDKKQEFIYVKPMRIYLEHSLLSISKGEAKWKTPFLTKQEFTYKESIEYIKCMTVTSCVPENAYLAISQADIRAVWKYIDDEMTATWFNDQKEGMPKSKRRSQAVTSELVYYWMVSYGIPFTCEKWHFNRLLTLIRICDIKNTPSKKMKNKDILAQNRALNAERRKRLGTKG